MNDLFSNSFKQYQDLKRQAYIDDIESGGGVVKETVDLDKFFQDVEKVKDDMLVVEKIYKKLQDANEESKMLQNANKVKQLRSKMDSDFTQLLKIVKVIKGKLEALDKSNVENRKIPGCGPGSSADRTRTSVVSGLGKKLKIMMDDFQELRAQINDEYKETIGRRYFTITGEKANDELIEDLISSGKSEDFLQKAIQEQGRGQIMDTISEIQERHDAILDIEKSLIELHQIFLDMAVLVDAQGQQLNDIESHVAHASSFVRLGTEQQYQDLKEEACVNGIEGGDGIDIFFEDVEKLKGDMMVVEKINKKLQDVREESKMLQDANKMKELQSKMDSDFTQLLKIVKVIKGKLEALDKSNVENRKIPGRGPDASSDRTRTLVVSDLGKKLKIMMDNFQEMRKQIIDEYKETIKSKYFILTGEKATADSIDHLISGGNIEAFLQKAIQDQGQGQIMDSVSEILERHDAIIDIEKNLAELHQVFLDIVVLIDAQGPQSNDTESQGAHANTFVGLGTEQVVHTRELQRRSQKCTCIAITVLKLTSYEYPLLFLFFFRCCCSNLFREKTSFTKSDLSNTSVDNMNDLFSYSSNQYQDLKKEAYVDGIVCGDGMDIFFRDVEKLKDDMVVAENIYKKRMRRARCSKMSIR
ncbi:t-SNARE [Artemisia annua]|uniref:t-SNARE n=1 Tax=Artemisia annua TaxID=35608 RepID=A0A2U1P6M9_ARTAN|nr:t-SNARE [Artemisia annua]